MLIVIIYIDLLELILLVLTLFGEGERVEGSDDPDFFLLFIFLLVGVK